MQDTEHYGARLRRLLIAQFILAAIGVLALVLVAVAVTGKLKDLGAIKAELSELRGKKSSEAHELAALTAKKKEQEAALAALQEDHARLKRNTEKLYAVSVTRDNHVYAVKASARATGKQSRSGPIYDFEAYIDAPDEARNQIERVVYHFEHDTFRAPVVETTDPEDRFKVGYRGWGCLNNVGVNVYLKGGETKSLDFNMCKSIGW